jgi:DNA-binding transcriptional regulator YdaS (Cro superfamily)
MTPLQALEKCVQEAGGQSELARRIGGKVKQQHVHYWLTKMGQIPPHHARACERAVDGKVTAEQLRPDIFKEVRAA